MPSFHIVSEIDMHELANALDQAQREITNRFDFKGVDAGFELQDSQILMHAEVDFQIQQMLDVLRNKVVKRDLDVKALKAGEVEERGQRARMTVTVQQGIETETARKIVKHIKDQKMKVQVAIEGEKLRVTAKKRDDLQAVIALLREGVIIDALISLQCFARLPEAQQRFADRLMKGRELTSDHHHLIAGGGMIGIAAAGVAHQH